MHREIASLRIRKLSENEVVDHRNRDGLDNRSENIRIATRSENHANSKKYKNKGASKFKGVGWDKVNRKWRAKIMIDYCTIHLGRFDSEIEAALAYNKAAIKLFGEFALINEID